MIRFPKFAVAKHPALSALCLAALLGVTQPQSALGQAIDATDLETPTGSGTPVVSGETPQLDIGQVNILDEATPQAVRNAIQNEIKAAHKSGFLLPENRDVTSYTAKHLKELTEILSTQSDPCKRAVETALFLNAKHPPNLLEYGGKLALEGLPKTLARIWILPDEYNALGALTKGWANAAVSGFDLVNKSLQTYESFVDAHLRAVIDRKATWTQEMVHQALRADYDTAAFDHARGQLDKLEAKNVDRIKQIEAIALREQEKAEAAYKSALKDARGLQRHELAKHAERWGRFWHGVSAAEIQYNRIVSKYNAAKRAAVYARHNALKRSYARRQEALTHAMEKIAQARVKRQALDRYVAPITQGNCDKLRDADTLKRDKVETEVIKQISALDPPRFESLMKRVGVTVPTDFQSCLCQRISTGGVGGGWTLDGGKCYSVGVLGGRSETPMTGERAAAAWAGCLDKMQVVSDDYPDGARMQDILIDKMAKLPGRPIAAR